MARRQRFHQNASFFAAKFLWKGLRLVPTEPASYNASGLARCRHTSENLHCKKLFASTGRGAIFNQEPRDAAKQRSYGHSAPRNVEIQPIDAHPRNGHAFGIHG